ncbi:hypothetical protein ACFYQA_02340 [Streptomyces sp. NPDC005774]|uniref:hypothetical protein n=1 Tax=Streptomyces sp. NPDC005774 TaxID=3364728 RepID=UPI0036B4B723
MTRRSRLLAALALALLALTACSPSYPPGPSGKVTDRDRAYFKPGGWRYSLTVDSRKFRVTRDDYKRCVRGSSYPACTTHG